MAPDGAAGDFFGESVAIYGDTIVVGADYDDDNGSGSGSAYVFVRSGKKWSRQPSCWHQTEQQTIGLESALQYTVIPFLLALVMTMTTEMTVDQHTCFLCKEVGCCTCWCSPGFGICVAISQGWQQWMSQPQEASPLILVFL